ncbi:restriction endonuclease subunit S [Simiduia aestuariiviva]|uniref:Type I restriction enzyme S subunit n=1 Tax=Simiduia aestuariiviva TaxID=1510459 RepID=A0A839UPY8_9GAMM|nr:restriction endonuclease subunit S [Simiduia aestuariiviva]MBB3167487.1 type I restriction enzyme S subunit [Simiduia aestuariiviva]
MSSNLVKLGEICRIGSSKRIKRADYVQEGIPFFRSKEIIELSKGNSISTELFISKEQYNQINEKFGSPDVGDILITSVGTLGVAYQVEQTQLPFYFKDGNLTWLSQFSKGVNPRWIFYWLNSPEGQRKIDEISIGSTQKAITIVALKSIEVQLPNKDEQDRTVKILDSVTGKISTNAKTNQTLEQIAQALFKSWIVDFDPVKAKISVLEAGGTTEEAELAAMSMIAAKSSEQLAELKQSKPDTYEQLAQTAALFPSAMQESELGEIPEGWSVSTIGEEVHISGGGTPSTKNKDFWENGSIHWTTPKDLSNLRDKVLADTERKITEAGLEKISSGLLPVNTVLMSSRAPVGYLALAKVPVAINQGYIAMRCEKLLSPEFTLQWAVSNMDEIKQRASGTTFAEISKKNFRPISVVVPTEGIIKKYSDQAQSLYEKIYAAVEETRALSSIRDTLLPQLLSGNKSLKEHIA